MYANEEYVSEAPAAGAAGYMLTDAGAVELELALQAVVRGESYLSPVVAKQVISGKVRPKGEGPAGLERLTPRQRETLQLIAEGHSQRRLLKSSTSV